MKVWVLFGLVVALIPSWSGSGDADPYEARFDEFPDPKNARYFGGELTMVDHVNRMGILRADRLDSQKKNHQDLPHHFTMLPYGMVYYRGAPATLREVPIGTHLHGRFYAGPGGGYRPSLLPTDYLAQVKNRPNAYSPNSPWSQALRLEDDFSFYRRQGATWIIVSVDRAGQKLVAKRMGSSGDEGLTGEQEFGISKATGVYLGDRIGTVADLAAGQEVLFNLTWATLFGPGRITEVWLDEESRELATARQEAVFREYQKDRGFPAMVEEVRHLEKGAGEVKVSFYQGFNESDSEVFLEKKSGFLIVVEPNLRSHGQGSDKQAIRMLTISPIGDPPPGHSGFVGTFHTYQLLEGVRPGRSLRLMPQEWGGESLPREERIWPFDIRPRFLELNPNEEEAKP